MLALRDYQQACHDAVLREWGVVPYWDGIRPTSRTTVANLATSAGKTLIAAHLADTLVNRFGGRVLFVADREELIQQPVEKFHQACGIMADVHRGSSKASGMSDVVVASIQTLARRLPAGPPFTHIIDDECFVAGTLVDGRPIETIQPGDIVNSWNEATGAIEPRRVTYGWRRFPLALVRVTSSGGARVICTPNHPLLTPDGWRAAGFLTPGVAVLTIDPHENHGSPVRPMRSRLSADEASTNLPPARKDECDVFRKMPVEGPFGTPEDIQSDARQTGCAGEVLDNAPGDGVEATAAGWERKAIAGGAATTGRDVGMGHGGSDKNTPLVEGRTGEGLQTGHSECAVENRNRDRREFTFRSGPEGSGQEKGGIPSWDRVESVEVLEPTGDGRFSGLCPDGFVYNLEVEGLHTYTANGVVVHNCHRNTEPRRKIHDAYPEARILGITATAFRQNMADLSKWYETVAFELGTFDLIGQGYITPIKVLTMPLEVDLTAVRQRSGDYDQEQVAMSLEPHYRAVARAIREHAADRQILAFLPLIRSSQDFVSILSEEGILAQHCDGSTPDRRGVIERFESGEFQVLSNSQVFSTGVDFINCDCLLNLAPTRSRVEYRQRAGRIMRLLPGTIDPGSETLPTAEERRAAIAECAKPNCIAEGTMILTDVGLVQIEWVTKSMRVWDGTCYRQHDGAIFKGEQETITYAGLTATKDHQVWTKEGWMPFEEAARNTVPIATTAYGRTAIREADHYFTGLQALSTIESNTDADALYSVRSGGMEVARSGAKRPSGMPEMRERERGPEMADFKDELCQGSVLQSEGKSVSKLRFTRHRVSLSHTAGRMPMDHGKHRYGSEPADRPNRQQRTLRGWESSVVDSASESIPYEEAAACSIISSNPRGLPSSEVRRLNPSKNGVPYDPPANSGSSRAPFAQTKGRVWDILNCGPLHRFTANGLLVHNCLILDLLWQTKTIGLAGPASLIATSEEEEEELAVRVKKQRTPEELADISRQFQEDKEEELRKALEAAAAQQAAQEARKASLLDARTLLLELHDRELTNYVPALPAEAQPVKAWQKEKLDRWGYDASELGCSGQATKLIDAVEGRQRAGMAPVEAFGPLRTAGFSEPHTVTLDDAIRALGHQFPMTFGKKFRNVPLGKVPRSFWTWLMENNEPATKNSRMSCERTHLAAWRYVTKVVYAPKPRFETPELGLKA